MNLAVCGGSFVVALGKDVPEGYQKAKKTKRAKETLPKEEERKAIELHPIPNNNLNQMQGRSKSSGAYGGVSLRNPRNFELPNESSYQQ